MCRPKQGFLLQQSGDLITVSVFTLRARWLCSIRNRILKTNSYYWRSEMLHVKHRQWQISAQHKTDRILVPSQLVVQMFSSSIFSTWAHIEHLYLGECINIGASGGHFHTRLQQSVPADITSCISSLQGHLRLNALNSKSQPVSKAFDVENKLILRFGSLTCSGPRIVLMVRFSSGNMTYLWKRCQISEVLWADKPTVQCHKSAKAL